MSEIFDLVQFRPFSYEEDPESLVDMHRCREHLEGSWFDGDVNCRRYHKILARAQGSSWVATLGTVVVGYADLLEMPGGEGFVSRWRIHPDYRDPRLARRLLEGLRQEAKKRAYTGLVVYSDLPEVHEDLEKLGVTRQRTYRWASTEDLGTNTDLNVEEIREDLDDLLKRPFRPFLGPPHPPRLVLARAHMAAEYGLFNFCKPRLGSILFEDRHFLGVFDGREWYIFRAEKHAKDSEAVKPLLAAIGNWSPGRIQLSEKALEISGASTLSEEFFWDLFAGL